MTREEEDKIKKKEVIPRPNRISKKKKGAVTIGQIVKHGTALPLTPDHPPHTEPGHGPGPRGPPPGAVYLSAAQVLVRYGGLSDMWLFRIMLRDPSFPRPIYFGKRRFFRIDELITWERASALRGSRRKTGRPRKNTHADHNATA